MSSRRKIAARRPRQRHQAGDRVDRELAPGLRDEVVGRPRRRRTASATARAAGSAGSRMRASSRTRTCPGSIISVAIQTTRARPSRPRRTGATSARCSTPFWSTTTTVPGPHSARQERRRRLGLVRLDGEQHDVGCHGTRAGSVSTGPGTISARLVVLDHEPVERRPAAEHQVGARPVATTAAIVAPIAPGPTTATRVTQPRRTGASAGPSSWSSSAVRRAVAARDLVAVAEPQAAHAGARVHLEHELGVARIALEQVAQLLDHGRLQARGVDRAAQRHSAPPPRRSGRPAPWPSRSRRPTGRTARRPGR